MDLLYVLLHIQHYHQIVEIKTSYYYSDIYKAQDRKIIKITANALGNSQLLYKYVFSFSLKPAAEHSLLRRSVGRLFQIDMTWRAENVRRPITVREHVMYSVVVYRPTEDDLLDTGMQYSSRYGPCRHLNMSVVTLKTMTGELAAKVDRMALVTPSRLLHELLHSELKN